MIVLREYLHFFRPNNELACPRAEKQIRPLCTQQIVRAAGKLEPQLVQA